MHLFKNFSEMSPNLVSGLIMLWAENILCFLVFILAMLLVGSKFPDQRSNSGPLQGEHGVLTRDFPREHTLHDFSPFENVLRSVAKNVDSLGGRSLNCCLGECPGSITETQRAPGIAPSRKHHRDPAGPGPCSSLWTLFWFSVPVSQQLLRGTCWKLPL